MSKFIAVGSRRVRSEVRAPPSHPTAYLSHVNSEDLTQDILTESFVNPQGNSITSIIMNLNHTSAYACRVSQGDVQFEVALPPFSTVLMQWNK